MIDEEIKLSKERDITFVIALISSIAVSWLIARFLETSIWYVWIVFQIINLVLWLVRSGIKYAVHLLTKSDMIDSISSALALYNYPNPTKYNTASVEAFFNAVMMETISK